MEKQGDAGHIGQFAPEPGDDRVGADLAFAHRLERNKQAAIVFGRAAATAADEGTDRVHRRIGEHDPGDLVLELGHGGERDVLRRLGRAEHDAGVLLWEESLGHGQIESDGRDERGQGDQQHEPLMLEHPFQAVLVGGEHPVKGPFTGSVKRSFRLVRRFRLEKARTHHRGQRQRDHARDQDRQAERHGELVEQAADQAAHEQQRDEHGDQRRTDRDHGKPDLAGAVECGLHRGLALLDVAIDILNDDNRIVHHEPDRNGDRHQREIVDAVIQQVHEGAGAGQGQRHGYAGDERRPESAQEQEDHHYHQADAHHQR